MVAIQTVNSNHALMSHTNTCLPKVLTQYAYESSQHFLQRDQANAAHLVSIQTERILCV